MKSILYALVMITMVSGIGVVFAESTPLDAVINVTPVSHSVVNLQSLSPAVFNDDAFKDDIGENGGLNVSAAVDSELAWRSDMNNWTNTTV